MPGVVANAAWAAQGGWGWFANHGDGDTTNGETLPPATTTNTLIVGSDNLYIVEPATYEA